VNESCTVCGCTNVGRVSSSEKRGSGWSADGLRVVLIQDHTAVRQSVNVWRLDLVRAVETEVVPTLVQRMEAVRFRAECGWACVCWFESHTRKERRIEGSKNNVKSKETN
jgi:hypothetical protein